MTFELQPHLHDGVVRLAPLCAGDFDMLYAVASDPLIWEQHPSRDRYRREVFENFFQGAIESGGAFCVRDDTTGEVIGSSRYYDFNERDGVISIGYTFLARRVWGRRFNDALKRLMLEHAFQFVQRVVFQVGSSNLRSRRAMEKLGAVLVAESPVSYYGEPSSPNAIYEIARVDWAMRTTD